MQEPRVRLFKGKPQRLPALGLGWAAVLLLLGGLACIPVKMDLGAPPVLSRAEVAETLPPEAQAKAAQYVPETRVTIQGRERLRLLKSEIGLMPDGGEAASALHRLVLERMLTAGFAHLSDLTPSARIGASYTQSTKVGALRLDGKLSDLMTLYPLSKDDYVIVFRASTAHLAKELPVTFSLDGAVLDDYEEALRQEDEFVREERTRLEAAVASYFVRYDKALSEYNDKVTWWQQAREPDGPPEKATYEAFVIAAHNAQAALDRRRKPPTREQLQRDAAERREVRSVEFISASTEVIVYEVNTGTIATVIAIREEGQDTAEALSRLADAVTTTLGKL